MILKQVNQNLKDIKSDTASINKNFTAWFKDQKRQQLDEKEKARESKKRGGMGGAAIGGLGIAGASTALGDGDGGGGGGLSFRFLKTAGQIIATSYVAKKLVDRQLKARNANAPEKSRVKPYAPPRAGDAGLDEARRIRATRGFVPTALGTTPDDIIDFSGRTGFSRVDRGRGFIPKVLGITPDDITDFSGKTGFSRVDRGRGFIPGTAGSVSQSNFAAKYLQPAPKVPSGYLTQRLNPASADTSPTIGGRIEPVVTNSVVPKTGQPLMLADDLLDKIATIKTQGYTRIAALTSDPEIKQQIIDVETKHNVKLSSTPDKKVVIQTPKGGAVPNEVRRAVMVDLTSVKKAPMSRGAMTRQLAAKLGIGFIQTADAALRIGGPALLANDITRDIASSDYLRQINPIGATAISAASLTGDLLSLPGMGMDKLASLMGYDTNFNGNFGDKVDQAALAFLTSRYLPPQYRVENNSQQRIAAQLTSTQSALMIPSMDDSPLSQMDPTTSEMPMSFGNAPVVIFRENNNSEDATPGNRSGVSLPSNSGGEDSEVQSKNWPLWERLQGWFNG